MPGTESRLVGLEQMSERENGKIPGLSCRGAGKEPTAQALTGQGMEFGSYFQHNGGPLESFNEEKCNMT